MLSCNSSLYCRDFNCVEFNPVLFLTPPDPSPEAALIIKSNRTQYIQSESVSLSCVAQDSASGWSLRRYLSSYPASLSGCPFNKTVTWDQSTCNISSLSVSDSGVYWCQSESGLYSNAVKITVNYGELLTKNNNLFFILPCSVLYTMKCS